MNIQCLKDYIVAQCRKITTFFVCNNTEKVSTDYSGVELHPIVRVVVGDRNMTEIGHGFFQSYNCGHRLTMVIKSLKKTSKSVRRYMKSWGHRKI